MCQPRAGTLAICLVAMILMFGPTWANAAADPVMLQEIEAADCEDLGAAYQELTTAEDTLQKSLKQSRTETITTNVIGVATLATVGLGFFSWEDTSEAEAYQADVREYLQAIRSAAAYKHCTL